MFNNGVVESQNNGHFNGQPTSNFEMEPPAPPESPKLTIIVGRGERVASYSIAQSALTSRGKFLEWKVAHQTQSGAGDTLRFTDEDPYFFELYLGLITKGLDRSITTFDPESGRIFEDVTGTFCEDTALCAKKYEELSALYVLAERLQDIKAKKLVVDAIIARVTYEANAVHNTTCGPCLPSTAALRIMYQYTGADCPGRQIMVDCFVYYGQHDSLEDGYDDKGVPPRFLLDLAKAAMAFRAHPHKLLPFEARARYYEDEGGLYKWTKPLWSYEEYNRCPPIE